MLFSLYRDRREAWKTGWILYDLGISNWYNKEDKTLVILKGPSLFASNLGLTTFLFKLHASSQALSPAMNRVNFDWIQIFIVNRANSWAAEALSLAFTRLFSLFLSAGRSVLLVISGSAWGSYPIMR